MRTTYVTAVKVAFNPFLATSKVPRLFLNVLPADAHKTIKVSSKTLPRTADAPASLELAFKDGKTLKYSWHFATASEKIAQPSHGNGMRIEGVKLKDIVEEVNRHARVLARQQELSG